MTSTAIPWRRNVATSIDEKTRLDLLAGNAHFQAWAAIMKTLDDSVPGWNTDPHKSPVQAAQEAIKKLAMAASQAPQRG